MQTAFPRIEHRWGERLHGEFPTVITAAAGSGVARGGIIGNLSLSGALIKTLFGCRRHALIEVKIKMPAGVVGDAILVAHVIRTSSDGLGIEWAEFAPQMLRRFLRPTRADATLVGTPHADPDAARHSRLTE